jgi:acetolactate decarboxylase
MRLIIILSVLLSLLGCQKSQENPPSSASSDVFVVGEMRKVMREGILGGEIRLDTLSQREHLFGLGPMAFLKGEITILDGVAYRSRVNPDSSMTVDTTYAMEAPFFGYARISSWSKVDLPDTVRSLEEIERYLDGISTHRKSPFFFRLVGAVADAVIHVVNLPDGSTVSSPAEAHVGQVDYPIANVEAELLGFYSTEHKAIFTHHDTNVHIHLITKDRSKMGHVDALTLGSGMSLYVMD